MKKVSSQYQEDKEILVCSNTEGAIKVINDIYSACWEHWFLSEIINHVQLSTVNDFRFSHTETNQLTLTTSHTNAITSESMSLLQISFLLWWIKFIEGVWKMHGALDTKYYSVVPIFAHSKFAKVGTLSVLMNLWLHILIHFPRDGIYCIRKECLTLS